jgi:hypothetical protein
MTLTSEPGLAGAQPGRGDGRSQDGRYQTARPDQADRPYLAASPFPGDAYPSSNGAYADAVPAQAAGTPAGPAAAAPPVVVQTCWMCGVRLPATLMVPDGGAGCPDIRWYCQDARQCTERWTSRRPPASI